MTKMNCNKTDDIDIGNPSILFNCSKFNWAEPVGTGYHLELLCDAHVTYPNLFNTSRNPPSLAESLFSLLKFPISPFASQCLCYPASVLLLVLSGPHTGNKWWGRNLDTKLWLYVLLLWKHFTVSCLKY